MRSSWPGRLLVVLQVLAEGGWLAVVYAAAQVATGDEPRVGPLELALLAGVGMAWARRRRWRLPAVEAVGLPLLALVGGAIGWFLDPTVRGLIVDGFPRTALSLHLPGWLAAIAVIRGGMHGMPDDDEGVQDRVLRYGIPGLAVPWLVGSLAAPSHLREAFTAIAFLSTMIFAASAFAALGLARLEVVRATTGGDWRQSRSWVALMAVISLAVAVIGLPAAIFLGVPLAALATLAFGPIRLIFLAGLLLSLPFILVIATVTEMLRPLLPTGFTLPSITFPGFGSDPVQASSPIPTIVVIAAVLVLAAIELGFLALVIYLRWQERRRMAAIAHDGFEERSIVIPPEELPPARATAPRPHSRRRDATDPVGAYLAALEELDRDGRWRRDAAETPAMHARRVRAGLGEAAIGRLALAYELVRYGSRQLTDREAHRARRRLDRLRQRLRRALPPSTRVRLLTMALSRIRVVPTTDFTR
ncbi:MAG: DUF4129 domain-containing protein [Candidatus Limnocylindria bacterium]